MSKTLLSIMIALLFVSGVAGVAIVEAKQSIQADQSVRSPQSQTGQVAHSREQNKFQFIDTAKIRQSLLMTNEQMVLQGSQTTSAHDPCSQVDQEACGVEQGIKVGHHIEQDNHPHHATAHQEHTNHDSHDDHEEHE